MGEKRGTNIHALAFEAIASGDKDFIVSAPNRKTSGTLVDGWKWREEGKSRRLRGWLNDPHFFPPLPLFLSLSWNAKIRYARVHRKMSQMLTQFPAKPNLFFLFLSKLETLKIFWHFDRGNLTLLTYIYKTLYNVGIILKVVEYPRLFRSIVGTLKIVRRFFQVEAAPRLYDVFRCKFEAVFGHRHCRRQHGIGIMETRERREEYSLLIQRRS